MSSVKHLHSLPIIRLLVFQAVWTPRFETSAGEEYLSKQSQVLPTIVLLTYATMQTQNTKHGREQSSSSSSKRCLPWRACFNLPMNLFLMFIDIAVLFHWLHCCLTNHLCMWASAATLPLLSWSDHQTNPTKPLPYTGEDGDYKLTVNQVAKTDAHPLPRIEDICPIVQREVIHKAGPGLCIPAGPSGWRVQELYHNQYVKGILYHKAHCTGCFLI